MKNMTKKQETAMFGPEDHDAPKHKGKHTPGPWTAWDDDGTGTLPCVLSKQVTSFGNFYVAQCNVFEDARLIAAAPDGHKLLGMINAILTKYTEGQHVNWPLVKADIGEYLRKVEGRE